MDEYDRIIMNALEDKKDEDDDFALNTLRNKVTKKFGLDSYKQFKKLNLDKTLDVKRLMRSVRLDDEVYVHVPKIMDFQNFEKTFIEPIKLNNQDIMDILELQILELIKENKELRLKLISEHREMMMLSRAMRGK